ncbi:DUF411 domain-containing protein [Paracoccus sp. (in: a-proteobacteria)]|uniref:DUF411 domain-containing protein n=1 Tax=Paracoccus sp. TaxID=267 RepID=UPI00321FEBB2
MTLTRRNLLIATALACLPASLGVARADAPARLHVLKDPACGCCGDWVEAMRAAGFEVSVEDMPNDALARVKAGAGITPALASCHTARVEGYVIEGHVPPADVRRLLAERPAAIGLSVPGMPYGAPGMGPESEREAYDVILIGRDGSTGLFASYAAA